MNAASPLQLRRNSIDGDLVESGICAALTKKHAAELAAEFLPVFYPKGGIFFFEGQTATGVFLLRSGRAKETMSSSTGKTVIASVAGPGAILGLSAVLMGTPHGCTVETLEPSCANYVRKVAFLHLLKVSRELSQMVASQLLRNCEHAYAGMRCLGVSNSVTEKFVRLLLQWAESPLANANRDGVGLRVHVTMTYEEIGQCVGSTRETISRILGELRKKKWVTINGSIWTINNEDAIRKLAAI